MGERAQRGYEAENRKAFSARPWRDRMRGRMPGLLICAFFVVLAAMLILGPLLIRR